MYWIEVKFTNGKTLRKESENLNESYEVWERYTRTGKQPQVQQIKAGRGDTVTGEWTMLNSIAF